jgi:hypothetical protein
MMARARVTTPERRRRRERGLMAGAAACAAIAGLLAAHFGTHRVWEVSPAITSNPTSTSSPGPFVVNP